MNEYIESVIQLSQYLHLFPCYGIVDGRCECGAEQDSSIGKHPRFGSYVDHATQDEEQIRSWLNAWPNTNFAAHCAKSGVFVLDTDPRSGGHASRHRLDELTGGAIPDTVTAQTGRYSVRGHTIYGTHEYFVLPEGVQLPSNLKRLNLSGLDIKANGYVIVPPSQHVSGVRYEWKHGLSPHEFSFAEAPDALLDLIVAKRRKKSSPPVERVQRNPNPIATEVVRTPSASPAPEGWDHAQTEPVQITNYGRAAMQNLCDEIYAAQEGERNTTLNRAAFRAGYLIALRHVSYDEASRYLSVAARRALNPLPEEEIAGLLAPGRGIRDGYEKAVLERQVSTNPEDDNERSARERLNLVNWAELFTEQEEENPWLVEGLIARGRGHVLYSDAGLGKSILSREIAAKLSAGLPLLGLPGGEPIRVLYLDNENSPKGDVLRSLQSMGLTPDELGNFFFAAFPDIPSLNTAEGGAVLEEVLDDIRPDLVIFDTASRFVEGDENSNDTWNALYNYAGKALKSRGIAYIRIDHEGKSTAKGQRGGSAKKGDVDLVWHFEGDSKKRSMQFTLTNEKSRIPLVHPYRVLDRLTRPLRHQLRDPLFLDWIGLMAAAEEYFDEIDARESVVLRVYTWLSEQEKGMQTSRERAFDFFKRVENGEMKKRDVEALLKQFRAGKSVADVLEAEFPQYDATWLDEEAA